ncbi:hypothetical protein ON010_g8073 [Phytophthora cinnamomi]|nr:hypothetical protein ON010_g8073 [Phytophthora cinnamomi]
MCVAGLQALVQTSVRAERRDDAPGASADECEVRTADAQHEITMRSDDRRGGTRSAMTSTTLPVTTTTPATTTNVTAEAPTGSMRRTVTDGPTWAAPTLSPDVTVVTTVAQQLTTMMARMHPQTTTDEGQERQRAARGARRRVPRMRGSPEPPSDGCSSESDRSDSDDGSGDDGHGDDDGDDDPSDDSDGGTNGRRRRDGRRERDRRRERSPR